MRHGPVISKSRSYGGTQFNFSCTFSKKAVLMMSFVTPWGGSHHVPPHVPRYTIRNCVPRYIGGYMIGYSSVEERPVVDAQ